MRNLSRGGRIFAIVFAQWPALHFWLYGDVWAMIYLTLLVGIMTGVYEYVAAHTTRRK